MNWKDKVKAGLRGRKFYESEFGIGIEFHDKSDAFWLLPNEPMSTVHFSTSEPIDVDAFLLEFERIDNLRRQTLHVLRQHLAKSGTHVSPSGSGTWSFDAGQFSGEIYAGEELTRAAARSNSVVETIKNWQGSYWGNEPPSERRIVEYLERDEAPFIPLAKEDASVEQSDGQSISQMLQWMGLCKTLNKIESPENAEEICQAIETPSRGRIYRALQRVAIRLPDCSAIFDLFKPNSLCIDFSDRNASFEIDTHSRELAKLFRSRTPESVGDQLVDEFQRLDAARSSVLNAIWQAAGKMGWSIERTGLAFFGVAPKVFLGKDHREVEFPIANELTELLRKQTPESTLLTLFSRHQEFLDECRCALRQPGLPVSEASLPTASLLPVTIPDSVPLVAVDVSLVTQMDHFGRKVLEEAFQSDVLDMLWKYDNVEFYNPEIDDWFPKEKWYELAKRQLNDKWPSPVAIKIMQQSDVEKGDDIARAYVKNLNVAHHESDDATIELIWRYRHDYPEVARAWLGTDSVGDYDEIRGRLGDPVASRRISFSNPEVDEADELSANQIRGLPEQMRSAIHQEHLAWAKREHRCSPLDVEKLRVAGQLGWSDVYTALEDNPYLLPGLLGIDDRPDCFDEPGLLMGSELLLVWSAYAPSRRLGQIVATAQNSDLVALAKEASLRSAARNSSVEEEAIKSSFEVYCVLAEQLRQNLAIAWFRCRRFFEHS